MPVSRRSITNDLYLQSHDPDYLRLFNQFLAERDRHVKYQLYEQLAVLTLAPVGALWQMWETTLNLDTQPVTPVREEDALDFWEMLVCGTSNNNSVNEASAPNPSRRDD